MFKLALFNPIRRSLSDDVNGHSGIKETCAPRARACMCGFVCSTLIASKSVQSIISSALRLSFHFQPVFTKFGTRIGLAEIIFNTQFVCDRKQKYFAPGLAKPTFLKKKFLGFRFLKGF